MLSNKFYEFLSVARQRVLLPLLQYPILSIEELLKIHAHKKLSYSSAWRTINVAQKAGLIKVKKDLSTGELFFYLSPDISAKIDGAHIVLETFFYLDRKLSKLKMELEKIPSMLNISFSPPKNILSPGLILNTKENLVALELEIYFKNKNKIFETLKLYTITRQYSSCIYVFEEESIKRFYQDVFSELDVGGSTNRIYFVMKNHLY